MINTKSIISTAVSSVLIISIYTVPTISTAGSTAVQKNHDGRLMLAQAHQHGHDKKSEYGDHSMGNKHGNKKRGGMMMKNKPDYAHMVISHTDKLKLSNEQLGKIVRLHLKYKQVHMELKKNLKNSMQAFRKESMVPSTSDAQLHKLGKNHTNAFNAMVDYHIKERHTIHAVLSDEQKKQLNTMKMDHSKHSEGHSHH